MGLCLLCVLFSGEIVFHINCREQLWCLSGWFGILPGSRSLNGTLRSFAVILQYSPFGIWKTLIEQIG